MESRISPRKAIHGWLAQNESLGRDLNAVCGDTSSTVVKSISELPCNRQDGKKHHEERQSREIKPLGHASKIPRRSHLPRTGEALEDSRLADRFDLQTPFRHLEAKDLDRAQRSRDAHLMTKRYHISPASSYLEPAVDISSGNDLKESNIEKSRNKRIRDRSSSARSYSSQSAAILTKDQRSRIYERRPRHKTREDRYELKETKEHSKPRKDKKKSKKEASGKYARTGKTGTALLHNFVAGNVASDRLTMRMDTRKATTTRLGLFTKGRASSPVRRKGLPDLSFSEMNFLNTRREAPQQSSRESECKRLRKETRATVIDDEMSHFFASTEVPRREHKHNNSREKAEPSPNSKDVSANRQRFQHSSISMSSTPVTCLPPRPFLGFGEPGPRPDNSQSLGSHRHSLSPLKPQAHQSPSLETCYFPWSTSPNRPPSFLRMRMTDEAAGSLSKKANAKVTQPQKPLLQRSSAEASAEAQLQVDKSTNSVGDEELKENKIQPVADPCSQNHMAAGIFCPNTFHPGTSCVEGHSNVLASENNEGQIIGLPNVQEVKNTDAVVKNTDAVGTAKQDTLDQFKVAINELLDKWKDKISVPNEIVRCIQNPSGTASVIERPQSHVSPTHDDSHPQNIPLEDIINNKEELHHVRTSRTPSRSLRNPAVSAEPDIVVGRGLIPSRHSSRSRNSLAGISLTAAQCPQLRISSPFHDSTYSTCRGTESIYEQQIHGRQQQLRYARIPRRNHSKNALTNSIIGSHDSPYQSTLTQVKTPTLGEEDDVALTLPTNRYWDCHGLDLPPSILRTPVRPPTSIWQSCHTTLGYASPSTYGEKWDSPPNNHMRTDHQPSTILYQNSYSRDYVPEDAFQNKILAEEGLGHELRSPGRAFDTHNGREELRIGNEKDLEMEIEPSGFWKPNLLY